MPCIFSLIQKVPIDNEDQGHRIWKTINQNTPLITMRMGSFFKNINLKTINSFSFDAPVAQLDRAPAF